MTISLSRLLQLSSCALAASARRKPGMLLVLDMLLVLLFRQPRPAAPRVITSHEGPRGSRLSKKASI